MLKRYRYLLWASILLLPKTTLFSSEPSGNKTTGYVVIETNEKAPRKEAFLSELPSDEIWQSCTTRLNILRKKLTSQTEERLAPLFTLITDQENVTPKIADTLDSLLAAVKELLMRTRPLAYHELQEFYKNWLTKVNLSTHHVYPLLDIKNTRASRTPLEVVKQIVEQKKNMTKTEISQKQEELSTLKNKLLTLELAQAQQESPNAQIASGTIRKMNELRDRITTQEKVIKSLEEKLAQLQKIERIFRNSIAKETYDAFLGGEENLETLKIPASDETLLQKMLTAIEHCKKDLEPKKTTVELPAQE